MSQRVGQDVASGCAPLPLGEGLGVRAEADPALEWGEPSAPPPPKGEARRGLGFAARWRELEWDDIGMQIRAKTTRDVERALANPRRSLQDFMALISPAAEAFLPQMAAEAERLTRQRFGNTVGFYVPLYLSNLCANDCSYCGFSMSNRLKRKTLDAEEIERECLAIKARGFDSVLLVTGEHESKVGMAYFREHLPQIRRHFSALAMEVQPLSQADYAELKTLGLDAVMVYQETYHAPSYARHHLRGNKQDIAWRLATPERLGRAGIDKIGLGALIGLSPDWRADSYFVAEHLAWMERHHWQSRYSLSFPRLRPCTGGLQPEVVMSDRQLVQLICAWRLFSPTLELSLSTRESPAFRNGALRLGITQMSAESRTQPGGYAEGDKEELEQFAIHDARPLGEVADAVRQAGLQPVFKDWEAFLGR
ncbi:2-iminoacetate synthase ThiH [Aeromonas salmonicida]|uniref:2-iminoacetate synthase ThiH n=1 Tax=Aeromonas salmonicida TaxID=645 RepID=UPI000C0BFFA9|nr:2-iminoacetate synthase ThiH [Aeromonas salmonicida]MBS2782512.1 2-iminoacetate synthase ThiH [Aeromonas salmonicida]TNI16588.1 2-iminoacetate synthase ThiH [Aeromonas salmonicida]HEH9397803.1 2-iminoacetate synthase ThiH [Aeromonas salmonicida]